MRIKRKSFLLASAFCFLLTACSDTPDSTAESENRKITDEDIDRLGITNKESLSAASKRALAWPRLSNEWFGEFKIKDLKGDLAWAISPHGPWTKSKEPILSPADNGIWEGEEQNRFKVRKKGDFDSHKVHDPCIIPFQTVVMRYVFGHTGEELDHLLPQMARKKIPFNGRQMESILIF